ncbi:hypothetical protein IJG78_01735 [Candidatus Saccharibacteria bacterium]|nr:hypothetical protein [Candidatus Saccharibacteria bacterium]
MKVMRSELLEQLNAVLDYETQENLFFIPLFSSKKQNFGRIKFTPSVVAEITKDFPIKRADLKGLKRPLIITQESGHIEESPEFFVACSGELYGVYSKGSSIIDPLRPGDSPQNKLLKSGSLIPVKLGLETAKDRDKYHLFYHQLFPSKEEATYADVCQRLAHPAIRASIPSNLARFVAFIEATTGHKVKKLQVAATRPDKILKSKKEYPVFALKASGNWAQEMYLILSGLVFKMVLEDAKTLPAAIYENVLRTLLYDSSVRRAAKARGVNPDFDLFEVKRLGWRTNLKAT